MHQHLNRNLFLIKEHVGMFKAANNYDIHDPETGEIILECREETLGPITKLLRFTKYKQMTPFNVEIRLPGGPTIITVKRGISIFLSDVSVTDENGELLGGFKQKLFSIGGKFDVLGPDGSLICTLKGKWTGWNFRFLAPSADGGEQIEFASVSKKWAGLGKEFFTSADNYILQINDTVPQDHPARQLILAAVICIDMVLKE